MSRNSLDSLLSLNHDRLLPICLVLATLAALALLAGYQSVLNDAVRQGQARRLAMAQPAPSLADCSDPRGQAGGPRCLLVRR